MVLEESRVNKTGTFLTTSSASFFGQVEQLLTGIGWVSQSITLISEFNCIETVILYHPYTNIDSISKLLSQLKNIFYFVYKR